MSEVGCFALAFTKIVFEMSISWAETERFHFEGPNTENENASMIILVLLGLFLKLQLDKISMVGTH